MKETRPTVNIIAHWWPDYLDKHKVFMTAGMIFWWFRERPVFTLDLSLNWPALF